MARAAIPPTQALRRGVPGRFRVELAAYNKTRRYFKPIPQHAEYIEIKNIAEARLVWSRVTAAVQAAATELEALRAGGAGDAGGDGADDAVV